MANGNGIIVKWILGIAASLVVLGVVAAVSSSMATSNSLAKVTVRQQLQYDQLTEADKTQRQATQSHSSEEMHPGARAEFYRFKLKSMETNLMVGALYKAKMGKEPITLEEMPED